MDEMTKMKSEKWNSKLMPLPLNVPKYLASKAKPDKMSSSKLHCIYLFIYLFVKIYLFI